MDINFLGEQWPLSYTINKINVQNKEKLQFPLYCRVTEW
jgi:hypothetical protein